MSVKISGISPKGLVDVKIELSKGSCWNFTPRGPETGELCTTLYEN